MKNAIILLVCVFALFLVTKSVDKINENKDQNISFAMNDDMAEDKVLICHIPPGKSDNPQSILVGASSVAAHLAHGDFLGSCSDGNGQGDGDPDGDNGGDNGEDKENPNGD